MNNTQSSFLGNSKTGFQLGVTSAVALLINFLPLAPPSAGCSKAGVTVTCTAAGSPHASYTDATPDLNVKIETGAAVSAGATQYALNLSGGGNTTINNSGLLNGMVGFGGLFLFGGVMGKTTTLNNLQNGSIEGGTVAGVHGQQGRIAILNFGTINSTNSDGILLEVNSNNSSIENSNTITGKNAIHLKAVDQTTITNHLGARIEGSTNGIVIESNAGQTNEIYNDGTIKGTSKSIIGGAGVEKITNNGNIEGQMDLGEGDDVVTNSGHITGSITLGDGNNEVTNTGTGATAGIDGDVVGGKDTDKITNNGRIKGNVFLADGTNTATNNAMGTISGVISAGNGDNTITNDGLISGGVEFGNATTKNTLTNNGAGTSKGIAGQILGGTGADEITNNGDIGANISLSDGKNVITNKFNALIQGSILTGKDDDTLDNFGTINLSNINLGDGANVLTNTSGGTLMVWLRRVWGMMWSRTVVAFWVISRLGEEMIL